MPSLLTLPRELRDQIYEHVLVAQDGRLDYRTYYGLDTIYTVVFCGRVHEEPFEISKSCSPREERDEHHNQLRFVSRQLYNETAGLEFRLNDVLFHGETMKLAHSFLRAIRVPYIEKNIHQFGNVHLIHLGGVNGFDSWYPHCDKSIEDRSEDLLRLAQFCRENQKIQVRYTIPHFDLVMGLDRKVMVGKTPCYVPLGIYFMMALRGKDLSFLLPLNPETAENLIHRAMEFPYSGSTTTSDGEPSTTFYEQLQTPNLRFWPLLHPHELSPGTALMNFLQRRARASSKLPRNSARRMQDEHVLDWAQNGF